MLKGWTEHRSVDSMGVQYIYGVLYRPSMRVMLRWEDMQSRLHLDCTWGTSFSVFSDSEEESGSRLAAHREEASGYVDWSNGGGKPCTVVWNSAPHGPVSNSLRSHPQTQPYVWHLLPSRDTGLFYLRLACLAAWRSGSSSTTTLIQGGRIVGTLYACGAKATHSSCA